MGRFDGKSTEWYEDLEYRSPRPNAGGQHVGTYSGVLVHHKPTGICVLKEDERSQIKNRNAAIEQLRCVLDLVFPGD